MPTKVLSVAEKPSVAKQLALVMNRGQPPPRRNGKSQFNANYTLQTTILGNEQCDMVMTSVSGHMMDLEFGPECVSSLIGPVDAMRDCLGLATENTVLHTACLHPSRVRLHPSCLPKMFILCRCKSWSIDESILFTAPVHKSVRAPRQQTLLHTRQNITTNTKQQQQHTKQTNDGTAITTITTNKPPPPPNHNHNR